MRIKPAVGGVAVAVIATVLITLAQYRAIHGNDSSNTRPIGTVAEFTTANLPVLPSIVTLSRSVATGASQPTVQLRELLTLVDPFIERIQHLEMPWDQFTPRNLSRTVASSLRCSLKGTKRLEYTHRKPRKHEYSTLALRTAVKSASTYFWQDERLAPLATHVVGHPPVCFTPGVNISAPFGSWRVRYFPTQDIIQGLVDARPPQVLELEPIPYVAVFAPGIVSRGSSVACDGTTVTSGGCLWDVRLPSPLSWRLSKATTSLVVSLCDEWCKGYYHFTHEHLPRIAPVFEVLRTGAATLALSHHMNGFQRQFFVDILQIPKISEGEVITAEQVLHPTPMRCGNTFSVMLHQFREVVFRQLKMSSTRRPGPLRLLFAERGRGSRMASNYADIKQAVEAAAKRLGVICRTTRGTEHAREQIRMFHDADIVVGPHGANLANSMFMRRGCHVIEMASMVKGNMCYYTTSVRVGLTFHFVPHTKGKDDPYTLDPNIVVQHIEFAVNRSSLPPEAPADGAL